MSELNYASTLAALDDEFASASASTGSGSVPVGRYNAMIKEAKIVARTGGGLALSVSFVVTEGEYKGRYAFTSYGLHKNGLPYFKGFLQTIQLPLERLSELEQILCFDSAIDAEKFASERSAIFLILPEEDTTKNFMAGLMIQNLSRELFAVADENGGKLKNRVVLFCDEFGTMPPFDILPLFSAGRSRRLTLVPIIQSLAQLEKNYGKEGCEIIQDNCQDTIFGGFAPNSQTAEVLSKALGSRTVLSGSVSRGKNDPSQSLQMMERALLTPDELKSIPKGSFIVMKTGTHPMRTRLQLFLNWGITFGEPYTVPERANRAVAYANRVDLERNLPKSAKAEEAAEHRGYAVSGHGGMAHEPVQERTRKRGKSIKSMEEENT